MEPDYTNAAQAQMSGLQAGRAIGGASTLREAQASRETALGSLSDHANAAGRIGDIIEQFLDRCRGGGRDSANKLSPAPTGHFAQLERLSQNLARAEELARELGTIG